MFMYTDDVVPLSKPNLEEIEAQEQNTLGYHPHNRNGLIGRN